MESEIVGGIGTALVLAAYVPQIRHLYVERCAWGISVSTWWIWLAASLCLLAYSVSRGDALFVAAQAANAAAVTATIVLARRSDGTCPRHCGARGDPVAAGDAAGTRERRLEP